MDLLRYVSKSAIVTTHIHLCIYMYIYIYIYAIMKTMCPRGYHNGFVATHAQVSKCMSCLPQSHCGDNQEGKLLLWLHIYIHYAHLAFASVWFELLVCREPLRMQSKLIIPTCQNYICEHNKKEESQEKMSDYFKI